MKVIEEIYKEYLILENFLVVEENKAFSKGFNRKFDGIRRRRFLNDQSTFLFLFTRFEGEVNEYSKNYFLKKSQTAAISNFKKTSPWEILKYKNLSFMKKISLLTKKGNSDYNLIQKYYKARNRIAHGDFFYTGINISNIFQDFHRLRRDLKP